APHPRQDGRLLQPALERLTMPPAERQKLLAAGTKFQREPFVEPRLRQAGLRCSELERELALGAEPRSTSGEPCRVIARRTGGQLREQVQLPAKHSPLS